MKQAVRIADIRKRRHNNDLSFLVFSDDWGEHPSSCQHIFKQIIKKHPALWVNTIGTRNPKLTIYDLKKALIKVKKMLFPRRTENARNDNNLTVIQPIMLPFFSLPGIKLFNKYSIKKAVSNSMKKNGINNPIMVITAPNAHEYIGSFGEKCSVYYCVDDYSEWPGLNKKEVIKMESELIRKCNIFVATSDLLYNKISNKNKDVQLLTHGVDLEFYAKKDQPAHKLLNGVPRPQVGYFGLFDDRSDKELIKSLSLQMPDVSFIITGSVDTDIRDLRSISNIYFTGSVPYKELPQLISSWDICMLPYKINELTNAIQPLKIKEYLASGKPVISTPIKEVKALKEYVYLAETPDQWRVGIQKILRGGSDDRVQNRADFLKSESWEIKADHFLKICTKFVNS
ncbi:MAG: glycosyltransferase [Candidatus Thiodiazotropha sp. (ex Dulcina madagascariensis)]|nr:glycosyltransferase [Candidatus Thiodiazotropha sp. (ex Dulcina madagascariensis)]MCU7926456.1 glycosyltransferase [Candidatus Thiodiazotropha sp. (ex Dulcina madagascariensis)]